MRESIASMVLSAKDLDLAGSSALDAFAGSGGVGLELVSRGAERVTFCERDGKAVACIRKNAAALGLASDRFSVVRGDVLKLAEAGSLAGAPFDIVFLDPPYKMEAAVVSRLVADLHGQGSLRRGCLIVYEREGTAAGLEAEGLVFERSKVKGTTGVDLYRFCVDEME
jgi:16S rRNA (guanine966-N2)-methyltransferase